MRARLQVVSGRVGYRRRGSHELCAVDACPVLVPALEAGLRDLARDPPRRDGEWELACAGDELRSARLGPGSPRHPSLSLRVAGETIRSSLGAFAQANAPLLETLVARVLAAAGSGDLLLELFAGSGLFTLPLARAFQRVVAVESHPAAVRDLRSNVAAAGLGAVNVLPRRVEELGADVSGLEPACVLLDPPRTGLPDGGVELLERAGAARIVYLSCDPATLARDLRGLCELGYRLGPVEAFDLLPQTPHLEVLARLERKPEGRAASRR